jgi:ABC-type multidrug transport system fused ATPase/permease subunit
MSPAPEPSTWTWRTLVPFVRPDLRWFLVSLGAMPILAGLGVLQPVVLRKVVDEHITVGEPEGLQFLAGVYLASVIASFLVEGVYAYCLVIGAENTILRVRHALFRQVLSLNQRFFERQPTGQLMSRATSDVEALNEAISAGSISLVLDVLSMVSVLAAMCWLDWRLAALLCLVGPPVALVIEFARRRMRLLFAEIRDSLAALNAYAA